MLDPFTWVLIVGTIFLHPDGTYERKDKIVAVSLLKERCMSLTEMLNYHPNIIAKCVNEEDLFQHK